MSFYVNGARSVTWRSRFKNFTVSLQIETDRRWYKYLRRLPGMFPVPGFYSHHILPLNCKGSLLFLSWPLKHDTFTIHLFTLTQSFCALISHITADRPIRGNLGFGMRNGRWSNHRLSSQKATRCTSWATSASICGGIWGRSQKRIYLQSKHEEIVGSCVYV